MVHHLPNPTTPTPPLIATGRAMRRALTLATHYAPLRDPILLDGPTGTGKSTLARWIHDHSPRASHRFVHVNCGAIPSSLFASEVFGHARGAFTGATHDAEGLARSADGGTLFLDEIGELTLEDQRKLLTFVETGRVRPVGGTIARQINVRIIVATHRDLTCETTFRQDLRYRLDALRITLPSVLQRPEDLPELVRHLVRSVARENEVAPLRISAEAQAAIAARDWPGNVRELRNVLLKALMYARMEGCPRIDARHVGGTQRPLTWKSLCEGYQEAVVAEAVREHGSHKEAMDALGLGSTRFYEVLKRTGSG